MTDGVFLDVKGTLPLKGENEGISSVMIGFSSEACLWKTITFFIMISLGLLERLTWISSVEL